MAARRHRPAGFTLIELLVVIAILALLVAIMSPALNSAMARVNSAICASSLRQLNLALRQYLEQNERMLWDDSKENRWNPSGRWFSERILPNIGGQSKTLLCPTADGFNTDPWSWGSATTVWGGPGTEGWWMGGHYGSYGMNIWLTDIRAMGWTGGFHGRPSTSRTSPDGIPVLADCVWTGSWPRTTDLPPYDLRQGATPAVPFTERYHGIARHCVDRHDMAVNVAFLDGRTQRVRLAELWQLNWSPEFQPRYDISLD